ncbi:phosphodiester glycosidase family protein [Heyndrickxia acidicola]|uniref:Phosphodiester glycosidase family protein n=1 Tax=Heyndrickxia acidicola TaxID=209389 RepID=A0ABU6ML80_9BACI|nr:phosphodiester glycosidase family protein [Heyndrickxia acidicola]MED1205444.1 phosphodiester glycosidase family protein [Heyndrickxia acidicola]
MNKDTSKSILIVFALTALLSTSSAPKVSPKIFELNVKASEATVKSLPLGKLDLNGKIVKKRIAKGLIYTHIVHGKQSDKAVYIVDIAFRSERSEADAIARRLKSDGFNPTIETITKRANDDPDRRPLGYLVRMGAFPLEKDAETLRKKLSTKGYKNLIVVNSEEDGGNTTGPWIVNVLEVTPKIFKGKIVPILGTGIVPGRERVSSIAARSKAIAAINGGYFVMGASAGTVGDLAGVSMIKGNLISEAFKGRTSVILKGLGRNVQISGVKTELTVVSSDGSKTCIDGLNRKLRHRRSGNDGNTISSNLGYQHIPCTNTNELIQFTPVFGQFTEAGEGTEAVLNSKGMVTELRNRRGGAIPRNGTVLSGTKDASDWLKSHAKAGMKLAVNTTILADGKELPIDQTTGIINGGPRLLRNGSIDIPAFAEGFFWRKNPESYYRFGIRRHPRTMMGVKADGSILLVTVDGRYPGNSIGTTLEESAEIMKFLGAVDAVNLDGGGSTTMTIGSKLVMHPSDPKGERPVGDAILIMP